MDEFDPQLTSLARRVEELAREAPLNSRHRVALREDLLRRHGQLMTEKKHAGPRRRLPRRMTLVASPILALAASLVLLVSGLGPSGRQTTPAVEAARITQALTRTVPTVTSLRITLHRQRAGEDVQAHLVASLQGRRLFLRNGHAFIYVGSTWYQLTTRSSDGGLPSWQWAFVSLPTHLAHAAFAILPARIVDGHHTVGVRYSLLPRPGVQAVYTAWVDRDTGLLVRLQRDEVVGTTLMERDFADYQYGRAP